MLLLLGELNGGNEEVSAPDQVALKEILNHVEGEDHKVNDATLADFVRKVCMIMLAKLFTCTKVIHFLICTQLKMYTFCLYIWMCVPVLTNDFISFSLFAASRIWHPSCSDFKGTSSIFLVFH